MGVKTYALECLEGEQALNLFDRPEFLIAWDQLHQRCPWQTVFQTRAFVHTWYRLFSDSFCPIIIRAYEGQQLTGLFPLARALKGNMIIGAGGDQAEYHVWLSENDNNRFIKEALTCLENKYPKTFTLLRYVPARAPRNWLTNEKSWRKKSILWIKKQPLMHTDLRLFEKRLNAKTIREKIKRLQRLGELKLVKVTQYEHFASIIDELIIHYEFRKGATYNLAPFTKEPNKKKLLLELFKLNLLHVTVLKLNDEVISSTVNTIDGNRVLLKGLNAHVPFYSKHSPGLLHLLMLGKHLSEEGYEAFDLTPGDDLYKDKLATHIESPAKVWITSNRRAYYRIAFLESLKMTIFNQLVRKGKDPKMLFTRAQRSLDNWRSLRQNGEWLKKVKGYLSWKKKPDVIQETTNSEMIKVRRNNLYDLLQYDARGSRVSRWKFLTEAMKRFEYGEHAFTLTENGQLMACAWLRGKYSAPLPKLKNGNLPEESAVIHALYTHNRFKKTESFLNAVAEAVSGDQNKQEIYFISKSMSQKFLLQPDTSGSIQSMNDKDSYYQ